MIKTLSPYYVSIPLVNPNTSVVCNSYTLKIYIWIGNKYANIPTPSYQTTKINAASANSIDKVDIARLVNDFIVFNCEQSIVTSLEDGNNQAWVRIEVFYDDQPTIPQLQSINLATKGYGYFMEGENPQIPINKVLLQGDEFKVSRNGTFSLPIILNAIPSSLNAVDDTFNIYYQETILNVLSNDNLGYTPTSIIYISPISPTVGTLTVEGSTIKFTPGTAYTTPITFDYRIRDNSLAETIASVTLNISNLPTLVTAIDDHYTSDAVTVQNLLVLNNDVLGTLPTNIISINTVGFTLGNLSIDPTNQFITFTPNGTPGENTFQYTIQDSTAVTSTAVVTITIEGLYSFHYTGTFSESYPTHASGTVKYIDINDNTIFEYGLYSEYCTEIIAKSIISVQSAVTCTP